VSIFESSLGNTSKIIVRLQQSMSENAYGPLLRYFQASSTEANSTELASSVLSMWPLFGALLLLIYFTVEWIPQLLDLYGQRYFGFKVPMSRSVWDSFIVPFSFGLLLCLAAVFLPTNALFFLVLIFTSLYGVIRLDAKFHVIPDRLHLIGLLGSVGFLLATNSLAQNTDPIFWTSRILYATLIPTILILMNFFYNKFKGEQPLGLGDIKLLAWLSLLLGNAILVCFTLGLVICCLWTLPRLLWGRLGLDSRFAFGPFIVAGVGLQVVLHFGAMLN